MTERTVVECGICGTQSRPLYCGACASSMALRSRVNVMKVSTQLQELHTSVEQAIDGDSTRNIVTSNGSAKATKATTGLPATRATANTTEKYSASSHTVKSGMSKSEPGNAAYTAQQQNKITLLMKELDQLQSAVTATHDRTAELRQQSQSIANHTNKNRVHIRGIGTQSQQNYSLASDERGKREAVLEKGYRDILHLSLGLQAKCCQDLLEIFSLKKKRKKAGFEIVLGFTVIPELSHLGHYSITTINSGLERVAMFILLFASYLGLRLPYEVHLPQKCRPRVMIGAQQEALWLPHSVKTMMRSSSAEFHAYCRLLAMLALDVASIALKLGLPGVSELSDITRINQLVAQIYLRVESLIRAGHSIQIYSGALSADLDSLQDHIITAIDVELNGKSVEWNIVEAPEDI